MRRMIEPDPKLEKMLSFAKIIVLINLIMGILRIFSKSYNDIFFDLICSMFLMMASFTIYYLYMAIYQIFCLISAVSVSLKIGIVVQTMIQKNLGGSDATLFLSISSVILVFYVFAIIFTYPMYKEMRAQTMESIGSFYRPAERNIPSNQDQERPQANRGGFVAFSGRGVAVGG